MSVDPIPSSTASYIASPAIAENYDEVFARSKLFIFDTAVLDQMLPEPCKLADLGCGTGRHVVHFASKGCDVTAVDLSQHMLVLAAAKCNEHNVRADFRQCELTDLAPLEDASFDAVLCMFSTLGMIRGHAGRVKAVREAHRILKPGGLFVFHTHNRWHNLLSADGRKWLLKTYLTGWLTGEIGDRRMDDYRGIPDMFLHVFSLAEIRRVVAQAGLEIEKIIHINERRDAELPPGPLNSLKANGFIVACRRAQ